MRSGLGTGAIETRPCGPDLRHFCVLAKDIRLQLLENQLIESYDERVLAADRLAEAIHSTRTALEALTSEIRAKR
jgi:hypothetical protein